MAYRVFTSPDGTIWHAWDVPGEDRPQAAADPVRQEVLRQGWVCFECEGEKRRLSPVPGRWAERSEAELWLYCRVADPVPHRWLRDLDAVQPSPGRGAPASAADQAAAAAPPSPAA